MPQLTRKRKAQDRLPAGGAAKRPRRSVAGCRPVSPEGAGLSPAPLEELRALVDKEVHEIGSLSGVAHLILKDGRCVFSHESGWANAERGSKFGLRTLCALHSCSKPLTVAAFLTLVDDGTVQLSDPIEKYLSFSRHVVSGPGSATVRARRTRPTLKHLLTQTAGLRHSDDPAYSDVVSQLKKRRITDLTGFCDALTKVPLQSEPGAMHYYSLAIDVLGRVCEVASGQKLDRFVADRLLRPLGMLDTHFVVPPSKSGRLAGLYDCRRLPIRLRRGNGGKAYRAHPWTGPKMDPRVFSGGGGILSYADAGIYGTAEDYARFCQMLLSGGKARSGRQVLRPSTVDMLWKDCLAPCYAKGDGRVPGWSDFGGPDPKEKFYWDHHAWSLLNATLDLEGPPTKAGPPRRGRTLWMYGMGAYWFVDAPRKIVAVSFAQCFSNRKQDRGSDCVPFLKRAIDEGREVAKGKPSKPEIFYGKDP